MKSATLVEPVIFREALSRFPSGVTVVVTEDSHGGLRGFTASAFTALSQDPPLVLVCLARTADSFPAFLTTSRFAIHIAAQSDKDVVMRFATKGADKFAGDDFQTHRDGLPVLNGGAARLSCTTQAVHDGGDHVILVGLVEDVDLGDDEALVYHDRKFKTMAEMSKAQ
ncbi:flavin reductase family protein [Pseudarthrobacter sp. S9]|uniref:flavin reductase family protein n=1 Tax=Pseudarthrobacter sp. S9 TaxID=3418421 RepID=UPI003D02501C